MPNKYTIEYVKDYVSKATNGECFVEDSVYKNYTAPLHIVCKCGEKVERNFEHILRGQIYCRRCSRESLADKQRKSMQDVISAIEQTGCTYVSGEYKNTESILTIKCRCGNLFDKRAGKFFSGQDRCPQCGNRRVAMSKTKYSVEDVCQKISEKGYTMVDKKQYVDASHKVKCRCSCGHEFDLVFSQYLIGCSGCQKCAITARTGAGHWNYQDGKSEVLDSIRKALKPWKAMIKAEYGGKCAITEETPKRIDVHHVDSFMEIVHECCEETGIPLKKHMADYEDYTQYEKLKNAIVAKHTPYTGLPISHSIHTKFHKKYSKQDTTKEQFELFLFENYGLSLEQIFEKQSTNRKD